MVLAMSILRRVMGMMFTRLEGEMPGGRDDFGTGRNVVFFFRRGRCCKHSEVVFLRIQYPCEIHQRFLFVIL